MAFHQAFDDRDTYISEQPWQVKMRAGFEASVPLPGCPYYWGDAERWGGCRDLELNQA